MINIKEEYDATEKNAKVYSFNVIRYTIRSLNSTIFNRSLTFAITR